MSVYKLAATGTGGTENGIAQLDVQFDGLITSIHGDMAFAGVANGNFGYVEASFISTSTRNNNDTRGSLFSMDMELVIAGAAYATDLSKASNAAGLAIAVNAGERLWLHIIATAARAVRTAIYLYVEDGQGVPTAQRRR